MYRAKHLSHDQMGALRGGMSSANGVYADGSVASVAIVLFGGCLRNPHNRRFRILRQRVGQHR